MEDGGQRLKRIRDRLGLRYRDVETASQLIAQRHNNDEFTIALSRLSDIENKGTVPTFYRLYSLCAIYHLDFLEVLQWYGIDLSQLPGDSIQVEIDHTRPFPYAHTISGSVPIPLSLDPGIDLRKTSHLSRLIQRWGTLPMMLLNGLDLKNHQYGLIGMEDWWMHPLLHPGSLVLIDEAHRKPVSTGWTSEYDRPIYFFEHRDGYTCSWCSLEDGVLTLQPHPSGTLAPRSYSYPTEIDVLGRVTGVAMRLGPPRRRRTRS